MGPAASTAAVPGVRWGVVTAISVALGALLLALAPPGHAASGGCQATPEQGCLAGEVRSQAGGIEGVEILIEGPETTETVTTAADGSWSAAVGSSGTHTLTLDVGTLPEGEQLVDPEDNPRELRAVLGATRLVKFDVGEPVDVDEAPSGESGSGGTDPLAGGDAEVIGEDAPAGTGITSDRLAQQAAAGLRFGLVLALASVGLSLIFGTTGLSSFAHGEQVTLGAFLSYILVALMGWPLVPSIILVVILCAATGWLQDAGIWRPLRRRGIGLVQAMIVTIGLSLALQYLFQLVFGGGTVRILDRIPGTVTMGPVRLNTPSLWAMGLAVVALVAVGYFLLRTRTGRATRAVSDNPALASASGIDVDKIIRLVWIIATGLAGLSGVMLALIFNGVNWTLGMQMLFLLFAAVTLGGLGTAFGALAGALVIGMVVELANLWVPSDLKYASALLILILVLVVRPQGILGRAERIG